jgi:hypothetical protein
MGGRDQDPRGRPTHQNLEGSKQLLSRIFISQHRNAYVSMEARAEHIQYQLPNQHSRVGFLLDAIQNNDAGLQADIASVRTDDSPTGKRNDSRMPTMPTRAGTPEETVMSFERTIFKEQWQLP